MRLIESVATEVYLAPDAVPALESLGRRLAGSQLWWGAAARPTRRPASVIHLEGRGDGALRHLTVRDAVGVIAVGGTTFEIHPKIPLGHFLGLLENAAPVFRTVQVPVTVATGESMWDLVARWFVESAEQVVRRGLLREYRLTTDTLRTVRGRIDVTRTAVALGTGRLDVTCEFDEFDFDHALNRVLLAALRAVAAAPAGAETTRMRARRAAARLDGISSLQPSDLVAQPDARTRHYARAVELGKLVLNGTSVTIGAGPCPAWAFLIRTPNHVEEGLRRTLDAALRPGNRVAKTGRRLGEDAKTVNPDLVFDAAERVGDIKYRLAQGDAWNDPDLYQVVAFAAGFDVPRCLLLTFSADGAGVRSLTFGKFEVTEIRWDARDETPYRAALDQCVADVKAWLARS